MARPRPKKSERDSGQLPLPPPTKPTPPAATRILPMQLRLGDRLIDETGEWEIVGRPYMTAGGKTAHVRIKRLEGDSTEIRTWGARADQREASMSNNQRVALASLVLSACLQGCAMTPTVMDKADPVAISSTDPRYSGYLRRVHELIRAKMSYPCVKDEATGRCDYKPARLTIEFSLLQDGQIDYVRVTQKAEWEVFDEYSVSAIRRAAPFPPVPPALMAQAKPGSAGVRILVSFEYRIVDPNLPR